MQFQEILSQYNIPTAPDGHHHSRTGWVQFDCPFCSPNTHRYRMGYSLSGRFVNCWVCGTHRLLSTVCELTGISVRTAKSLINELPVEETERIKIKGKLKIPEGIGALKKPHINYLKSRGFQIIELVQLWHIEALSIAPELSWRVFIPIFYQDTMVSWTTRSIAENVAKKYKGAPLEHEAISKNELLYGEAFARHAIIVNEGPLDVWKIGPGAVCTFGLNFSAKQIERMLKYPLRYICFDNEPLAQKRANELVDMLSLYPGETYNIQLDSKDAGCATEKELRKLKKLVQ